MFVPEDENKDKRPDEVMPPEDEGNAETPPTEGTNEGAAETLLAGKYKSAEELERAYQQLQEVHGKHTNEVGEARKQMERIAQEKARLEGQLEQLRNSGQQLGEEQGYEAAMASLDRQVDEGTLSHEVAQQKKLQLIREQTLAEAREETQRLLEQKEREAEYRGWAERNPDFIELARSGAIDEVKRQYPIMNDMAAYYLLKAMETGASASQAAQEAYAKGREEVAATRQGAEKSGQVLGKPGAAARQQHSQGQRHRTQGDRLSSMEAALLWARGEA